MEIQEIIIPNDILRYIEVFGATITAIGAGIFGWKQLEINKRLKELQDYVAVSIIPKENLRLQIINVGKIKLYIHKWEVGRVSESYTKAVLIPAGSDSPKIGIGLNGLPPGEHDFKMYITDEKNEKYISTGKVFADPVPITAQPLSVVGPIATGETQESGTGIGQTQTLIRINLRAFSFKTEKYDWNL